MLMSAVALSVETDFVMVNQSQRRAYPHSGDVYMYMHNDHNLLCYVMLYGYLYCNLAHITMFNLN